MCTEFFPVILMREEKKNCPAGVSARSFKDEKEGEDTLVEKPSSKYLFF